MKAQDKAEKLHQKVNTFILSCIGSDGYPMTKAVIPGKYRESLNELYFCTNASSKFVAEITVNPKTSVYFYKRKLIWFKGCLLKGNIEIVTDMNIKERYWQGIFKDAYPQKSFTDPDFCVLKFVTIAGRFYADFKLEDFTII
ncbi:MAG: pyridoxamine 5'-phosphate oxidase family protein [Defluviitaleaceae bacterium]|nr:pyridoxamine 5'-phosphate oxidase family protein [Defluviitaleaceae bacterium]